jgi:hypothetical protein
VLENQGLLGIAFFEATAFIVLLVLFLLFRKDDDSSYFRMWLAGWVCFTVSALSEVAHLGHYVPAARMVEILARVAALLLFTFSVLQCRAGAMRRGWPIFPAVGLVLAGVYYLEWPGAQQFAPLQWGTVILQSVLCLVAGRVMWRVSVLRRGHGAQLLAGVFFLAGLHGLD